MHPFLIVPTFVCADKFPAVASPLTIEQATFHSGCRKHQTTYSTKEVTMAKYTPLAFEINLPSKRSDSFAFEVGSLRGIAQWVTRRARPDHAGWQNDARHAFASRQDRRGASICWRLFCPTKVGGCFRWKSEASKWFGLTSLTVAEATLKG
jgi:hypothetical protein